MSVWLCIPSARPPAEANPVLEKWRAQGYKIALWRDDASKEGLCCDFVLPYLPSLPYPGYAVAVNELVGHIWRMYDDAEWFVAAGDDTLPDPNHGADEIAAACSEHFGRLHAGPDAAPGVALSTKAVHAALHGLANCTFGVMQPTGDRWGDRRGAYIDRVAGSAWLGREFARRAYGGNGPLFPGYQHMFVDQELQAVAQKLGVFWQRPDLTQAHQHWGRVDRGVHPVMPEHLLKWNTPEHWNESKKLFTEREAAGFPGHEPI